MVWDIPRDDEIGILRNHLLADDNPKHYRFVSSTVYGTLNKYQP